MLTGGQEAQALPKKAPEDVLVTLLAVVGDGLRQVGPAVIRVALARAVPAEGVGASSARGDRLLPRHDTARYCSFSTLVSRAFATAVGAACPAP
jgi:hypothetical protein